MGMANNSGKWCVVRQGVWVLSEHETQAEAEIEKELVILSIKYPSQQSQIQVEYLEDAGAEDETAV